MLIMYIKISAYDNISNHKIFEVTYNYAQIYLKAVL